MAREDNETYRVDLLHSVGEFTICVHYIHPKENEVGMVR